YGAISAMVGVGLIAGTVVVQKTAKDKPMSVVIVAGLWGLAAGALILGGVPLSGAAGVRPFLLGAGTPSVGGAAPALPAARETPPAMQGRVSSTFMSLFSLAQALGMLLSGVLALHLGIRLLFITCGAATALLGVASWLVLRPQPQAAA